MVIILTLETVFVSPQHCPKCDVIKTKIKNAGINCQFKHATEEEFKVFIKNRIMAYPVGKTTDGEYLNFNQILELLDGNK